MALVFHPMVKRETLDHGGVTYTRTGVTFAHDGIEGLTHLIPLPEWNSFQQSGSFQTGPRDDAVDFRVPIKVTCIGTGVVILRFRIRLPLDFGDFYGDALELAVARNAGTQTVEATLYHAAAADSVIDGSDVTPASPDVWEVFTLTPGDTYLRGEWVTLDLVFTCATGETAEISDMSLGYSSGRGNVIG